MANFCFVGNSKVIAHALPKLTAPIDREYTLTFLFGDGQIRNDKQAEWTTLRHILQHFFYPVPKVGLRPGDNQRRMRR